MRTGTVQYEQACLLGGALAQLCHSGDRIHNIVSALAAVLINRMGEARSNV